MTGVIVGLVTDAALGLLAATETIFVAAGWSALWPMDVGASVLATAINLVVGAVTG